MVTKWAMIENGVVINIVLWDGNTATWNPPADVTMVAYDPAVHFIDIPITSQNEMGIRAKAVAALTANANDLTQDTTIIAQANVLAATTGSRTLAQLSGDVRSLAQAVSILAQHDTTTKRELGALIRLALRQFDSTDGT